MKNIARIIPCEGDGVLKTQGTKVMVGDQELSGVYKIELVADCQDVWRAVIHCHANPMSISALYEINAPSFFKKLKFLFFGSVGK